MRAVYLSALAFFTLLFSVPAGAATVTCGGVGSPPNNAGVTITISTAVGSSCLISGEGNILDGTDDPVNALLYTTLDTTLTSGLVPLTFSGTSSGSFSFTADSGYDSYVLGFQTGTPAPKPDWFAFALLDTITFGTWAVTSGTNTVTLAILYGRVAEVTVSAVPVPGALWLFGSVLAGYLGFDRWRKRLTVRRAATA